jgi:glutathione S-transferase
MSLTVHYHPLASFCWKVQIALYENDTPFTGEIVNLGDKQASARFFDLWPVGKMPVLRDEKRDRTVPETSIIIEYLDRYYPGAQWLLPQDEERRLDARLWDRFFDLYVHMPMQRIVADRLRPENERDPRAVSESQATLRMAYDMVERQLAARTWATGEAFSIADCAAFPALFYAGTLVPFAEVHPKAAAYFERLTQRSSVRRVLAEARPYFSMYPFHDAIPARFRQA